MPSPNDFEQEILELINRARLDPLGEYDFLVEDADTQTGTTARITNAVRFFNVDLNVFLEQLQDTSAVAPLAWDNNLSDAANAHSAEMIAQDTQSHRLPGEAALGQRVTDAGYTWSGVAENVFAFTQDPLHGHAGFYVDWGYDAEDIQNGTVVDNFSDFGDGIQDPPGHRNTILNSLYVDVGIAAIAEANSATSVGPYVVTQVFGSTFSNAVRILGVVFSDNNDDGHYNAGEAVGGVTLGVDGGTVTNWSSGGYQLEPSFGSGLVTVSVSVPALGQAAEVTLDLQGENAKLDIVEEDAGWAYRSSVSLTFGVPNAASADTPVTRAVLIGQDDADLTAANGMSATLTGNAGANHLRGRGDGDDTMSGGAGNDTLEGAAGDDSLSGGAGTDFAVFGANSLTVEVNDLGDGLEITSNEGTDTVSADVEQLIFSDRTITYAEAASLGGAANTPTQGDDTLTGTSADETISALAGDDLIVNSGGGRDLFDGGAGQDKLLTDVTGLSVETLEFNAVTGKHGRFGTTLGEDTVTGIEDFELIGDWNAILTGDGENNHLISDAGDDTLSGGSGDDTLSGGDGDDVYMFDASQPGRGEIVDTGGNDTLRIEDTPDRDAAEFIFDGTDVTRITAQGHTTIIRDAAVETVTWFRTQTDTVSAYENPLQLITDAGQATSDAVLFAGTTGNDTMVMPSTGLGSVGFSEAYGNAGDDVITLSSTVYSIGYGGDGDDQITALGENGFQSGGAGQDTLTGGAGADDLNGDGGRDTLIGGQGGDTLDGGDQDDELVGNEGDDDVTGGNGSDLAVLGQGDDVFRDNSQVSFGDDTVYANAGNDTILGGGGNDDFRGQDGNDSVNGGTGNDVIYGGAGYDTLRGGDGDDTVNAGDGRDLTYLGGGDDLFIDNGQGGTNGQDTVYANAGNDTVGGGNGNDVFNGQDGNDRLLGRLGNDRLFGGNQNDTMEGGDGNDTIAGGNGRDRAFMGNGNDSWFDNDQVVFGDDSVVGGQGNDTIRMGGGDDTVTGGDGADLFIFAAAIQADTVTDYQVGIDALRIDTGLWGGALSQAHLDSLSQTGTGTLVLDFGSGHSITFDGLASNAGLLDDITLV